MRALQYLEILDLVRSKAVVYAYHFFVDGSFQRPRAASISELV